MKIGFSIFIVFCFHAGFSQVSGPSTGTVGSVSFFTYTDVNVYNVYNWGLSNPIGIVATNSSSGSTYTGMIGWNSPGTTVVTFYVQGYPRGSVTVTVSCPTTPPTPNAVFNYPSGYTGCGSVPISHSGIPQTGMTWYWQSSPTGTSTANSTTNFSATSSGPSYLRSYCGGNWSAAQATSALTVNPIPTVSGSNQTICANTATSITLTNNVPNTTNTWTVSGINASGATNSSGSSGSQSPYTYVLAQWMTTTSNIPGTETYVITPSANGCTGSSISLTATVNPIPSISASGNGQVICSGQSTSININNDSGVSGTTYSWTVTPTNVTGAAGASNSTATVISQALATASSTGGNVVYNIGPSAAGCLGGSKSVQVNVNPVPNVVVYNNLPNLCSGMQSTNCTFYNTNSVPGTTFSWTVSAPNISGASGSSSTTTNSIFQNLALVSGTATSTAMYTIVPSATANGITCTGSPGIANVNVMASPTVSATNNIQAFCSGGNTNITLSNPNNISGTTYSWTAYSENASGGSDATKTSATTIAQTLTNPTGATNSYILYVISGFGNSCAGPPISVQVNVSPIPTLSAINNLPSICSGHSTSISLSNPNGVSGTTYSWNVINPSNVSGASSASNTSASSISQTLSSTSGITAGSLSYSITPSAVTNGITCAGAPSTVGVTVNPVPVVSTTVSNQTIFVGGSTSIPLFSNVAGTIFSYSPSNNTNVSNAASGNATPISQALSVADGLNPGSVTYNITPSTPAGCIGQVITSSVSVYPVPIISWTSANVRLGSQVTLSAQAFYDNYNWITVGGSQIGNSIITNMPGVYTLTVVKNGVVSTPVSYQLGGQFSGLNMNYIVSTNVMVGNITSPSSIITLPIYQANQNVFYFDGLGRPIQNVSTQASPLNNDIVTPKVYDAYDREYREYLPVTVQNNGLYNISLLDPTNNNAYLNNLNYSNGTGDKVTDDGRAFSEIEFEQSPLNRPLHEFSAGQNWYTSNKSISHQYITNGIATGEKIIAWQVNTSGLPVRYTTTNSSVVTGGYYAANQLNVKVTADEQGNMVRVYSDKEGHMILKKAQIVVTSGSPDPTNMSLWACTYYIYDVVGNLIFVIQPNLSQTIHQNDTYNPATTDLTNFAFQYQYDSRKRMIQKQIPGAGPVYLVYDNLDRLILTQDAFQRASNYWLFTKYDNLNRPIMTGLKDTTVVLTQAQMQTAVNNHFAKASARWAETYIGNVAGNLHGYSNKAYPVYTSGNTVSTDRYLTITYYDNYSFRSLWQGSYTYLNEGLTEQGYSQPLSENLSIVGKVTGTKVRMPDGLGYTWLKSTSYYDDKYRTIQTLADNYKGGTDRVSNVYDFVSKVLKSKTTHFEADVSWTKLIGVSLAGNRITDSGTAGWGNSGASSLQQLPAGQDGWMEVIASEANTNRVIGLSSSDPNANYTSINYAWDLNASGTIYAYENGTQKGAFGTYTPGDILRIQRTGTSVKYYANGVLKYTSTVASSSVLVVDASLNSANGTLMGVRTSFGNTNATVIRRFQYDQVGRLLKTYHQVNTNSEVLLAENEYNEIGQLVDKKLFSADGTSFKQSVDYRYNIRGWLTSINNSQLTSDGNVTNDDTDSNHDLFGMNLGYNNGLGTGNSPLFNGNISGIKWSTNLALGTTTDVAYNYTYDALNRIGNASYLMNTNNLWSASSAFNEGGFVYDQNGNIQNLTRTNSTGGNMDILGYSYSGNQVLTVSDTGDKTKGFTEPTSTTGNDYTYDVNGNLTVDQNKGITSITYSQNIPNLPFLVTKNTNEKIQYTYDATGRKWKQQVYNVSGALTKTTDYVGEFIYQNDTLQFINHEEGRIMMKGVSAPEYQYHLKDHLGNVRLTFTTNAPTAKSYVAHFENPSAETSTFSNYQTSSAYISTVAANATSPSNSYHLNGGYTGQVGIAKSLSVMPGDVVSLQAYAKYTAPTGTPTSYTSFVSSLLAAFNLSAPALGEVGTPATGVNSFGAWELGSMGDDDKSDTYKVFVTIILFDRNYNFLDVAYQASSGSGALISTSDTVKQAGYAYLYISNEHPYQLDVYFDDVTMSLTPGPVVQQEDFYPFGLKFNSYARENSVPNNLKLFQGQEHIDDLGLNWDSFKWRNHQPDIGRFFNVDPLAEKYYYNSPYAFSENKVTAHVELEGLEAWDIKYSDGSSGQMHGPFANQQAAEQHADNQIMISPVANPEIRSGVSSARLDPVDGKETRPHNGVDIVVQDRSKNSGASIVVPVNGKVVDKANNTDTRGNTVSIAANKDGNIHRFFHMKGASTLEIGKQVSRGQEIGKIGQTGHSQNHDHLHYEVRGQNGTVLNPKTENPAITNGSSSNVKVVPQSTTEYKLQGQITIP